jgi:hypothetical protein
MMVLHKCTPANASHPLPADLLYRKGRLSNVSSYILEGSVIQETQAEDGRIQKIEWGPGSLLAINAVRPATSKEGSFVNDCNVYISSEFVRILRLTNLYTPKHRQRIAQHGGGVGERNSFPRLHNQSSQSGSDVRDRTFSEASGASYSSLAGEKSSFIQSTEVIDVYQNADIIYDNAQTSRV